MSSIIEALDSHDTVIETLRCADWDGLEVWERLEALDRLETSGRRQRIVLHATGARFEVRLPLAAGDWRHRSWFLR